MQGLSGEFMERKEINNSIMIHRLTLSLIMIALMSLQTACNKGPKVIEAKATQQQDEVLSEHYFEWPGSQEPSGEPTGFSNELHKVIVRESLPASRYVYLKVEENQQAFWIATRKAHFETGASYYYRGGLLKTHFHSKEFDRVFDRIYLVSKLVPEKHGGNQLQLPSSSKPKNETDSNRLLPSSDQTKTALKAGTLSIAQLIQNPSQYEGEIIKIKGRCAKVNPGIMNRNWIHLKDGTADHYDLVVTSQHSAKVGDELKVEATVRLKEDYGAGYTYELILVNGVFLPLQNK